VQLWLLLIVVFGFFFFFAGTAFCGIDKPLAYRILFASQAAKLQEKCLFI